MGLQPTSAVDRRKRLPLALAAESRYVGPPEDEAAGHMPAPPPRLPAPLHLVVAVNQW